MERKNSIKNKQKWRDTFQKSKSFSQSSLNVSRKTSLYDAETSDDQELHDYLDSLKRKSGIRRLWSGDKFEKTVRDDEDKTPNISISSSDDNKEKNLDLHKRSESSDDFRPNIVMLSESPSLNEDLSNSSSKELFHGVQLADFEFSENGPEEINKNVPLNNDDTSKSITLSEPKNINVIMSNLHLNPDDIDDTEDEVAEEIQVDDDIDEEYPQPIERHSLINPVHCSEHDSSLKSSSLNSNYSPRGSTPTGHPSKKKHKRRAKSTSSVDHSYTMQFSTDNEASMITEKTESYSCSTENSKSHRETRSQQKSRHTRSSRSSDSTMASCSSRSSNQLHRNEKLKLNHSKKHRALGSKNSHSCDVGVQTGLDLGGFSLPEGLGIGMATSGQRFGMQYPSPIATHAVSADALEAVTSYNPAVVALTDMLRQQVRLVEQFVDANNRMYQAYTSNLNTQYRYTTLEDTLEFIKKNKPKTISMSEALTQVNDSSS